MADGRKMIGEFMIELSEDPDLLASYREDPEAVLRESGLTKEQQEIVLSNDLGRIRDAIRDEYGRAEVIVVPMHHVSVPPPPTHHVSAPL
jgi:hypothetical protein